MTTIAPPRQILASFARFGHGIDEFPYDPQIGKRLDGACTQTSLECCVAAVEDRDPSQANVLRYVQQMRKLRDASGQPLAAENGACTLFHIAWYAQHVLGKAVALQWNYQEPLQGDWHKVIDANAGKLPILMQVARGRNLIDDETGVRDEAAARGLEYHAIMLAGKQGDGYVCCDSDHPQTNQRFQVYAYERLNAQNQPVDSLTAAVPCGLMMLAMPAPHAPPVTHPLPPPNPPHPLPPDASERYQAALQSILTTAQAALK